MVHFNYSEMEHLEEVLASNHGVVKVYGGAMIKGGTRAIRAGECMSQNSVSMAFLPTKSTYVASAAGAGVQVVTVDDAHPFTIGDVITIAGVTGTRTISAINYATNQITVTATFGVAVAVDARIHDANNDTGRALGIALTPMKDRDNPDTATKYDSMYGDIAIRGAFIQGKIKNFDANKDRLGGEEEVNGVYAIK